MSDFPDNPLVTSARREAIVVAVIWLGTMLYTTFYCYYNGSNRTLEDITFVLGFPDWVFWGVIVPWYSCLAISATFAYGFMRDDPLGDDEGHGEVSDG